MLIFFRFILCTHFYALSGGEKLILSIWLINYFIYSRHNAGEHDHRGHVCWDRPGISAVCKLETEIQTAGLTRSCIFDLAIVMKINIVL